MSVIEWFAVRTHSTKEQSLSLELRHEGFETYLPLARVEKRRRDGLLVAHHRPLFPCYLFVGCGEEVRWWEIPRPGVKKILGYRDGVDKPITVAPQDIQELRARLSQFGEAVPIGWSRPKHFAPEMMVHILFGPFRDLIAKVQVDQGSRVKVLLWFAGAECALKLPRECLAVAV